jgi:hypothetical protein
LNIFISFRVYNLAIQTANLRINTVIHALGEAEVSIGMSIACAMVTLTSGYAPTRVNPIFTVIPAQAGIQFRFIEERHLDSRLRGNDGALNWSDYPHITMPLVL